MNGPLPELCRGALQVGLVILAQSALLLALGLSAAWLLRRRGPAFRSFVLQVTLAGVALGALASMNTAGRFRPVWRVSLPGTGPSLPSHVRSSAVPPPSEREREGTQKAEPLHDAPTSPVSGEVASLSQPEGVPLPEQVPAPPSRLPAVYVALAGVWAGVTGLLLLWLAACQWHLVRLRRRSRAITDGPAHERLVRLSAVQGIRPPRLLAHPHVRSPFLAGILHPAILLPMSWEADFDAETLQVVLAHELAHHARRDCAWTLLLRLTCALLWMQPLLWLLTRQLEQASEEACDLLALTPECPPHRYADCLLALAGRVLPSPAERTLGAGVGPIRSSLGRRIQNILDRRNNIMIAIPPRLQATIALGVAAAALGAVSLVSASTPAPNSVPAPPTASSIIGTWLQSPLTDATLITFRPDNRYVVAVHGKEQISGRYSINGDSLTITRDGTGRSQSPKPEPVFIKITNDTLMVVEKNGHTDTATRLAGVAPGSTLIGTWNGHPSGDKNTVETMTFQPNGGLTDFNPKAGGYAYGTYSILGDRLAITILRQEDRNGRALPSRPPATALLAFGADGNRLTFANLQNGYGGMATRGVGGDAGGPATASTTATDDTLAQARFMAGLTPVQGPGIIVTLSDSKRTLPGGLPAMVPPNLIHDVDINQVVNELKAAGAEAIAVNGQRLIVTSAVRSVGPTILINSVPQAPPYVIQAIGAPAVLQSAVDLPGGVAEQMRRFDPAMIRVQKATKITLPAYQGSIHGHYAHPVPMASGSDRPPSPQAAALRVRSKLLSLERQRDQAKLQLDAAREQINVSKMLTRIPPRRLQVQHLQTQIADAQAQVLQSQTETPPPSKVTMLARMNRYAALQKDLEDTETRNQMYRANMSNLAFSRANAARAQAAVAGLDAGIQNLQAER